MEKLKKPEDLTRICKRCGRKQGLIRKYKIYLCRQCFRDLAKGMGFEKYW